MKMKANVSLLVAAAPTLLMIAFLFKEVPIQYVVAAAPPGAQHDQNVPTPPNPQKSSKVHSSVKAGERQSLQADSTP